jgi:hypothetical protein
MLIECTEFSGAEVLFHSRLVQVIYKLVFTRNEQQVSKFWVNFHPMFLPSQQATDFFQQSLQQKVERYFLQDQISLTGRLLFECRRRNEDISPVHNVLVRLGLLSTQQSDQREPAART